MGSNSARGDSEGYADMNPLAGQLDLMSRMMDAEEARRQSLDELQQLAIELSTAIAGELVFRSIDANEHSVGGMVSMAVTNLGLDSTR